MTPRNQIAMNLSILELVISLIMVKYLTGNFEPKSAVPSLRSP
ncbi:hypothetical protein TRL7639_04320 [Falsiruegeria litorea R37]|uniref:Uncharacterized protein n=1 Tax=Falsiruegeria litorea R37 TaxID=1200284 RepID=A0A1Y5TUW2_9RHOB|nr:hypothetical protein TRL7639_04320 [Falsiruegeria litorea R37]